MIFIMLFVIGLSGCETFDRYNPFASKADVYGVTTEEAKRDSKVPRDMDLYSYDLKGYDKDLKEIELGFGSGVKHPVGTYIKAVKKGSDTRMHDVKIVKKEEVPENILKKLNENQKYEKTQRPLCLLVY